jgi:putative DNA primase/helicase
MATHPTAGSSNLPADSGAKTATSNVRRTATPPSREQRENLVKALGRVPEGIRKLPQWIVWREEMRKNKPKPTKVPYRARAGLQQATSTDPSTWSSFEEACAVFLSDHGKNFDGLGFCFEGSGFTGIDFDHVFLTVGGDAIAWADEIMARLNSYTELSFHGDGAHVLLLGEFEGGGRVKKFADGSQVEMYCTGRFFCMTGNQRIGAPDEVRSFDCQSLADAFDRGEIGPTLDRAAALVKKRLVKFTRPPHNGEVLDLAAFFQRHSIEILSGPRQKGGNTWYEIPCPRADANHEDSRDRTAFVGQLANGALTAGCLHQSCSFSNQRGNHWEELREQYEPKAQRTPRTFKTRGAPSASPDDGRPGEVQLADIDLLVADYAPGDIGNGQRFCRVYGDTVRFDCERSQWFVWDAMRWRATDEDEVRELAHEVAIGAVNQGMRYQGDHANEIRDRALALVKTKTLNNMLREAKPYLRARFEDFDRNHYLVNFRNGTLNLKTGVLREAWREDFITKLLPYDYDPDADCPRFRRYLLEVMGDDGSADVSDRQRQRAKAMVEYLERIFGYALTGDTSEKTVFALHGETDTGKTTLVQTMCAIMGEYATTISIEALTTKERTNNIEEQLFRLRGARLAVTSEAEEGIKLSVARLKQITQGQNAPIVVTPKFKSGISFPETHKLVMDCNHLPVIRGGGDDIWGRLRVIPFKRQFAEEEQDKHLNEALLAEATGILALLVRGYQSYQEKGLPTPAEIDDAVQSWRDVSDSLKRYLDECCDLESAWVPDGGGEPRPTFTVNQSVLWKSYKGWLVEMNEHAAGRAADFCERVKKLPGVKWGYPTINGKQDRGFFGISLKGKTPLFTA